ncbi:MAG: hypothetical protein IPN94_24315 [Sphingobacteriales bacterium]|nr:hypothetical protein [Sphingobacteriales bacterium]
MKIVVLLGSIRIGRHTHKAAEYLSWCLNEHPSITQVDLWDLASHPLPMMETPIKPNMELGKRFPQTKPVTNRKPMA